MIVAAMASACVNKIGMSPESFMDCPPTAAKYSSFGWLSPRISFSRELQEEEQPEKKKKEKDSDPGSPGNEFVDFEFRLEDPVNMLPADELFSDGKLVPMQLPVIRASSAAAEVDPSPGTPGTRRRGEVSGADPFLFSPKAPRCSSRWKELLGLKKLYQNSTKQPPPELHKTTPSAHRSIKHFLHRNSKSSSSPDSSIHLPLLRETAADGGSSARLSLSSSSSSAASHDHEDLPRLSLDSDKPAPSRGGTNLHRLRVAKARTLSAESGAAVMRRPAPPPEPSTRGVSVDSPRMNASGKIVFHSLERSSSSPGSFNGGPRYKYRGMERSYSANVRVTPVLNVPVCKNGGVFGFPLFSSSSSSSSASSYSSYQQKKEKDSATAAAAASGGRAQQGSIKNRSASRPELN